MPPQKRKRAAERPLTKGGVGTLLRALPEAGTSPVLQVAELRRLCLDASWMEQANEKDRPEMGDAFDVTLSDGEHKVKCALSTALNGKVYRGWLRPLVAVRVADWRHRVDERIDGAEGGSPAVVVITQLEAVRPGGEPDAAASPLPALLNAGLHLTQFGIVSLVIFSPLKLIA